LKSTIPTESSYLKWTSHKKGAKYRVIKVQKRIVDFTKSSNFVKLLEIFSQSPYKLYFNYKTIKFRLNENYTLGFYEPSENLK